MKTQYVCPVDPDVVLFEEDMFQVKMFKPDRIETCPKCGRSYFKNDCRVKLPGTRGNNNEDDRE